MTRYAWARPKGEWNGKPYPWGPVMIDAKARQPWEAKADLEIWSIGDECGADIELFDIGPDIPMPPELKE